jgi:hypothetical protein
LSSSQALLQRLNQPLPIKEPPSTNEFSNNGYGAERDDDDDDDNHDQSNQDLATGLDNLRISNKPKNPFHRQVGQSGYPSHQTPATNQYPYQVPTNYPNYPNHYITRATTPYPVQSTYNGYQTGIQAGSYGQPIGSVSGYATPQQQGYSQHKHGRSHSYSVPPQDIRNSRRSSTSQGMSKKRQDRS